MIEISVVTTFPVGDDEFAISPFESTRGFGGDFVGFAKKVVQHDELKLAAQGVDTLFQRRVSGEGSAKCFFEAAADSKCS